MNQTSNAGMATTNTNNQLINSVASDNQYIDDLHEVEIRYEFLIPRSQFRREFDQIT
ncbi:10714_t:CDS:2, partial [Entrophospora sp. SA101]